MIDTWRIVVENYSPFEREELVFPNIPLSRGTIIDGANTQREFRVLNNRGPGTFDWVQYWPGSEMETADYSYCYRDGSLRSVSLAFPVLMPPGVAKASRGDNLNHAFYSRIEVEVVLQDTTPNVFNVNPAIAAILGTTATEFHYKGDVASMTFTSTTDHTGAPKGGREIFGIYGPSNLFAWVKTFIINTRTVPPDWVTKESFWFENLYQLHDATLASSRTIDASFRVGCSRITEDFADDERLEANALDITTPLFYRVDAGVDVLLPEQKSFNPVWPGTSDAMRAGAGGTTEICQMDPDDWQTCRLETSTAQAIIARSRVNDGASLCPTRAMIHLPGGSALETSTWQGMGEVELQPIYGDWSQPPANTMFGQYHLVHDQDMWPFASDQDAYEKASNAALGQHEYFGIGKPIADNTSGDPGTGRYKRDPLQYPIVGHHANSREGGTTWDYGFSKMHMHTACRLGMPDLRYHAQSALAHGGFPIERRERNGERYNPKDYIREDLYPGLGAIVVWTLDGIPCYNPSPSFRNMLGKRVAGVGPNGSAEKSDSLYGNARPWSLLADSNATVMRIVGDGRNIWFSGFENAHKTITNYAHYLMLRRDVRAMWWLENVKNDAICGDGAWRAFYSNGTRTYVTSSPIRVYTRIDRSEARNMQIQGLLHMLGPDNELDRVTVERAIDSFFDYRFGNPQLPILPVNEIQIPHEVPSTIINGPTNNLLFPRDPSWTPFTNAMKYAHLLSLANCYRETALRFPGERFAEMVEKMDIARDEIGDHCMTNWASSNAVDVGSPGDEQLIHRMMFVVTAVEEEDRGINTASGSITYPGLTGLAQGAGKRLIYPTQTDFDPDRPIYKWWNPAGSATFVIQVLGPMLDAYLRGRGTTVDRENARQILNRNIDFFGLGVPPSRRDPHLTGFDSSTSGNYDYGLHGWSNLETATQTQWITWFFTYNFMEPIPPPGTPIPQNKLLLPPEFPGDPLVGFVEPDPDPDPDPDPIPIAPGPGNPVNPAGDLSPVPRVPPMTFTPFPVRDPYTPPNIASAGQGGGSQEPRPPDIPELPPDSQISARQTEAVDRLVPTVLRPVWRMGRDEDHTFLIDRDRLRNNTNVRLQYLVPRYREPGMQPLSLSRGSILARSTDVEDNRVGWAWTNDAPQRAASIRNPSSVNRRRPDQLSVGAALPLFGNFPSDFRYTLQGAQLEFDPVYGGMISKFVPNGFGADVLNLGGVKTRGMQMGLRFAALDNGEFRKFEMRQGGNSFTEEVNTWLWTGGWLKSVTQEGDRIEVDFHPCEYDPQGIYSVPGLEGGVLGAERGDAAIWLGLDMKLRFDANYLGIQDVWKVTLICDFPENLETGYFPVDFYLANNFDASQFTHLLGYDEPSQTLTTISTGSTGVDGYQTNNRVYTCNRLRVSGDDEPLDSASPVPSGKGGIMAAMGATDFDRAIMFVDDVSGDDLVSTSKSLRDAKGTGWRWWQNRSGSGGSGGKNVLGVASGTFLTGHLHPLFSKRTIEKGRIEKSFLMMTGTIGDIRGYADQILS